MQIIIYLHMDFSPIAGWYHTIHCSKNMIASHIIYIHMHIVCIDKTPYRLIQNSHPKLSYVQLFFKEIKNGSSRILTAITLMSY